jgi:hypothetical protein
VRKEMATETRMIKRKTQPRLRNRMSKVPHSSAIERIEDELKDSYIKGIVSQYFFSV